jgi:FkbM family methyltransferase
VSLLIRFFKLLLATNLKYKVKVFFINRLALSEEYEPWLDLAYKASLATKQGTFVDVGANTGQTLLKILSIEKSRSYIGFEPQIDCCFFIKNFINDNKLDTHTVLPVGLSNQNGILELLKRNDSTDSTASTVDGFRPDKFYSIRENILVTKGDEVFEHLDLEAISTVKIDVEGGELEVIDGLGVVIQRHKPIIIFEVLNHYLAVTGEALDDETIAFRNERNNRLAERLNKLGYHIFNILPGNQLNEIEKIEPKVSDDLSITDYIAIHSEYVETFMTNYNLLSKLK